MEHVLESKERTLVMFDSISSGLSQCLALVHADINHMTEHRNKLAQNADNNQQLQVIDNINKQTRLAMQYSKQLEAHLFKVEDLKSRYDLHMKMSLVVRNMTRAQSTSSLLRKTKSSQQQLQTATNKSTIKEFHENIDKIESEFESYMGTFLIAVDDVQGFARVCQGDVFEISIKYGEAQKFKTRIKVLKDNRQKCENRQIVFKSRIADMLTIKAYECKGLGRRILLGHKLCETRDLFTARSQLMTISLNQIGSIKLNLIVTWNPLHMAPNSPTSAPGIDISHISLPPTPVSSSTLSSLPSMPSLNGTTTTINIESNHKHSNKSSSCSSFESTRNQNKTGKRYLNQPQQQQESMYQVVDPAYGSYYVPPPDYITTNDVRYQI